MKTARKTLAQRVREAKAPAAPAPAGELVAEIRLSNTNRKSARWIEIRRTGTEPDDDNFAYVETQLGLRAHLKIHKRWTCNCRSGVTFCEHLRALWLGQVTEDPAKAGPYIYTGNPYRDEEKMRYLIRLTDLGREILSERWAIKALGAFGE
jgi:hypothetical protein